MRSLSTTAPETSIQPATTSAGDMLPKVSPKPTDTYPEVRAVMVNVTRDPTTDHSKQKKSPAEHHTVAVGSTGGDVGKGGEEGGWGGEEPPVGMAKKSITPLQTHPTATRAVFKVK